MLGSYKQIKRTARIVNTEESFAKGMAYMNTPLAEGSVKTLLNFDVINNGTALRPRPGLRVYSKTNGSSSAYRIVDSRQCFENDVKLGQHIVANGDHTVGVLTTDASENCYEGTPITPKRLISTGGASIHNIPVTSAIQRVAGTFGFNNSYYTFDSDGSLVQTKYDTDTTRYEFEEVEAATMSASEAATWGYNMLSTTPYNFACTAFVGSVVLDGIIPYEADGTTIALSPRSNRLYCLKCYYKAPTTGTYSYVLDYKQLESADFTQLVKGTLDNANLNPIVYNGSSGFTGAVLFRVRIFTGTNTTADPIQTMVTTFSFTTSIDENTNNTSLVNYDIATAKGLAYWRNRLVAYNVDNGENCLFISDVNNPAYFPYPNNFDTFTDPVVHVEPYLDTLLVFTKTCLYQLKLASDGLTWTKTLIQNKLSINSWDTHLVQPVQNMVFFKSGEYYYLLVPKAQSLTGELALAPISTNITFLLDHFETEFRNIIKDVYLEEPLIDYELNLQHYYNFVDYEDIHCCYVFNTVRGTFLNFELLYNTVSRVWHIYAHESAYMITPYIQDTTKRGTFCSLAPNGNIQFYKYSEYDLEDTFYDISDTITTAKLYKNYHMLDTGYRAQDTEHKKRYRELQYTINNLGLQTLAFYTGFIVDGKILKSYNKYKTRAITDPNDPRAGELIVEREAQTTVNLPNTTTLAPSFGEFNAEDYWTLDASVFPEVSIWKVRQPILGKGFAPRFKLFSQNTHTFEVLSMSLVYRQMNAR